MQKLFKQYLNEKETKVEWSRINPPKDGMITPVRDSNPVQVGHFAYECARISFALNVWHFCAFYVADRVCSYSCVDLNT